MIDLTNCPSPVEEVIIIEDDPPAQVAAPPARQHLPPAQVMQGHPAIQAVAVPWPDGQVDIPIVRAMPVREDIPVVQAVAAPVHDVKGDIQIVQAMPVHEDQESRDSGAGLDQQLSDKDLKLLWDEFDHRCDNMGRCKIADEELARLIGAPPSFVTNFLDALEKDSHPELDDDSGYDPKVIEAYDEAREEATPLTYEQVAKMKGIPVTSLIMYSRSRKHRTLSEFQRIMMENNVLSPNPKPISRFLVELNAVPFGAKFTYYDYFLWLERETIVEEDSSLAEESESDEGVPQGDGGAGGSARKRKAPTKKRAPRKKRPEGGEKTERKKAMQFAPEQVDLMDAELRKRTAMERRNGESLSSNLVKQMNDALLKQLNQKIEGWREVDRTALNRWMSRNRGDY